MDEMKSKLFKLLIAFLYLHINPVAESKLLTRCDLAGILLSQNVPFLDLGECKI